MLQYATPVNTRNSRYFDIEGYHPNVQSARRPKDVLAYIRKDGTFLDNWPTKRNYGEILNECTNYESFMNAMKDNQPKTDSEIFERVMTEALCISGDSVPVAYTFRMLQHLRNI